MEGKWVAHHDDRCQRRLLENGWCPECKLFPDMQSVQLLLYCPLCHVSVKHGRCPICGAAIVRPEE